MPPESAQSVQATQAGLRIDAIDVGYLGLDGAAAAFVVRLDRPASTPILVECGTAATQPRLEAGLASLGIDRASIDTLLLTHIHLDHAGGAGHWARGGATGGATGGAAGGADVFLHPFGVRHLADPAKLIASSRRVHGASYDRFYGDPIPCPPERLHAMNDGEHRERHGLRWTAIETPGHARHHHAWLVAPESAGPKDPAVLFAGDIAAMRTPGSQHISVPTPPPEFDLDAWIASLDRLEAIAAERPITLWLTHLGPIPDAVGHLRAVRDRLREEVAFAEGLLDEEPALADAPSALASRYRAWLWPRAVAAGVTEDRLRSFLGDHFTAMNLGGIRRWRALREPPQQEPIPDSGRG
jgi:glyoxylase-like metal-dependent hydrolase (beta-lactamase superfamily II)